MLSACSVHAHRIEPQPLQLISLRQDATLRPPVHPQLPNSTDTRACLHLWRQSGCLASLRAKMLTAQLISCLPYIARSVCCQFAAGKWPKLETVLSIRGPASHIQSANRLPSLGTGTSTSASHAASINIVRCTAAVGALRALPSPKRPQKAQKAPSRQKKGPSC